MTLQRLLVPIVACICWLATVAAAAQPANPVPAGQAVDLTEAEMAWIKAHPVIRVVTLDDYAPYIFAESDGRLAGLTINVIDLLAKRVGLKFEYKTYQNVGSALEAFKAGRGDVLPAVVRSPEREQFLFFTRPYSTAFSVIVTRTDSPYLNALPELNGLRVGTLRGAVQNRVLLAAAPNSHPVEYGTVQESLIALAEGKVDATYAGVATAAYYIKRLQLANLRLGSVIGQATDLHIGVRKDWPILTDIIDKALADISPSERKALDDHWIFVAQAPNRWLAMLKLVAVVAAAATTVSLFLLYFSRRLSRELAARRRIQAELEQAHVALARVSEEKSDMLGSIAHDLRSPITGVLLGSGLLKTMVEPANHDAHEVIAAQEKSCHKILAMVDELVSEHMLATGRRDLHFISLDLVALVRESLADMGKAAEAKGIAVGLHCADSEMRLISDESALRHVIDNLLSNAVKYSPPLSEISIELRPEGAGFLLRVIDAGPGVRPEERERIFERFARGAALPTGGEKSNGLGLWIVRRTLADLHGKVWCDARPDSRGSIFSVYLPRSAQVEISGP